MATMQTGLIGNHGYRKLENQFIPIKVNAVSLLDTDKSNLTDFSHEKVRNVHSLRFI